MVKNYILDTNVLIHDPQSIYCFEDNNVIIPLPVLEELDKLKRRSDSVGKSARQIIRELDQLRNRGDLSKGVQLDNGGTLKIMVITDSKKDIPEFLYEKYVDNWILGYVVRLAKASTLPTILVSKDISLRLKATALGIAAQDYLTDRSNLSTLPKGYSFLEREVNVGQKVEGFPENHYLKCPNGFFKVKNQTIVDIKLNDSSRIWGILPLNDEQRFAMDALLDDEVKLVTLVGIAGTGKTLIALACALEKVYNERKYKRIIVSRPLVPVGKDVGYLPGSLMEKLEPWMEPVMDNLEFLFS